MSTQYTPNSIATIDGFMYQQSDGPFGSNSYSIQNAHSSRIYFNQAPKLNPEDDFTVECWYKFDDIDFNGRVGVSWPVIIYDTANTFTIEGVQSASTTTKIRCVVRDYSTTTTAYVTHTITSANNVLSINTWHHIAVTRSGNTIKIYVDGAEVASLTTPAPVMLYRLIIFSFGRSDQASASAISSYANIRISRSCKYNEPFSIPTGPFEYTSDAIVMYQAPYEEAERHITTLMQGGNVGYDNEIGPITLAKSRYDGIAMDSNRNIYIADSAANVIRKIDTSNNVSIFAGIHGVAGNLNASVATTATFNAPVSVAVDSLNNVYVGDRNNYRIRKITQAGVVTTFSGNGSVGNANGASGSTTYTTIEGIAIDGSDNVYVADSGGYRIRKITTAGVSSTLAGSTIGYTDSATSTLVKFNGLTKIFVYNNDLFVPDYNNNAIRRVSLTTGATTTFDSVTMPGAVCGSPYWQVLFVRSNKRILMYHMGSSNTDFGTPSYFAANPTNTSDSQDGPLYSAKLDLITDMIIDRNNIDNIYIAHNSGTSIGLRKIYRKSVPLIVQGDTQLLLNGGTLHGDSNINITNKATGIYSLPFEYNASITAGTPFGNNACKTITFSGGANEYLNYYGGAETTLDTRDWCIEFWYQSTGGVVGRRVMCFGSTNNTNSLQLVQGNASTNANYISLFSGSGSTYWVNNTTKIVNDGLWHHIAITRFFYSDLRLIIDGVQVGATYTGAQSTSNSITQGIWLGNTVTNATTSAVCSISNFRLTKGSTVYPAGGSTLTVPTSPLSPIAGSIMLFNDYLTDKTLTKTNTQIVNDTPFTNGSETTSLSLSGVNTAITTNVADSSFNFTSEAFTIEGRFKLSSTNASDNIGLISCMNNESASTLRGWVVNYDNINKILEFKSFQKGAVVVSVSGNTIDLTNNTWFHVAVAQQGGSTTTFRTRIFVNGALYATSSSAITLLGNSPYRLSLGEWNMDVSGRRRMIGNISNVRILRGICLYTTTFTPSTTIPLTTYNTSVASTSFLYKAPYDSTYIYSVTESNAKLSTTNSAQGPHNPYSSTAACGSLYVDSNSQAITGPADFLQLGKNNFTIEFWIKPMLQPNISRPFTILGNGAYYAIGVSYDPYYGVANGLSFVVPRESGYAALRTNDFLTANKWHHIVFQRNGTTWTIYINGVSKAFTAATTAYAWTNDVQLDTTPGTVVPYVGGPSNAPYYLADLRIIRGTALYSGTTITVPTAPLTTIERTKLRLNFTNHTVTDSSKTHNVATKNGITISDIQSKNGTGSLYFDGVDDILTVPSLEGFKFGVNNFTIEFWIYPLAYGNTTAGAQIFGTTDGATTGYSINLGQDISSFRVMSNAVNYNTLTKVGTWGDVLTVPSNGGPALNEWTHMAIVRDGANFTIYKNGVAVATTSAALNWYFTGTNAVIGKFNDGTTTRHFNGYIDMLRVTSNRAVYTTAFIPPARNSAAF